MPSIINATTTNGLVTSADNSGSLQLQTNSGTTAVTIDTSQNVGIGTSSPTQRLSVSGSITSTGRFIPLNGSTILGYVGDDNTISGGTGSNIGIRSDTAMLFATGGATERMRIDSSGNFYVGKTTNSTGTNGFVVQPNSWFSNVNTNDTVGVFNRNGSSGVLFDIQFQTSRCGTISVNTNSTTYATSSDYRLKENIAPMTGALDKVAQLKPVTYNWKAGGSSEGFIAHELQEVVPDCVTGEKDEVDADGNPVYQGVDTSFLVATLTAALQEAHGLIKDLQARVETLEAK